MKIGFLHTADIHIAGFDALLDREAPGAERVHRVEPDWLAEARREGLTPALQDRVTAAIEGFDGADAVLCTCSTLGPFVDRVETGIPAVRIDRPMLERAVECGPRILVAYCLESTRAPTLVLLNACARAAGRAVEAQPVLCETAWPHFEAGDQAGFARAIAWSVFAAIEEAGTPDGVVLAQASMRAAEELLATRLGPAVPVLSSPRAAVARTVRLAQTP